MCQEGKWVREVCEPGMINGDGSSASLRTGVGSALSEDLGPFRGSVCVVCSSRDPGGGL